MLGIVEYRKSNISINKEAAIILILCFVCSLNINAQSEISKNEISITLGGVIMNKLELENNGEQLLNSKYTISPLIEFSYSRIVYKSWGVKMGAGGNKVSYNTNFHFNVEEGNLIEGEIQDNESDYFTNNFNFFLLVNYQTKISSNILISADIGFQRNHIAENSFPTGYRFSYYIDSVSVPIFQLDMYHKDENHNYNSLKGSVYLKYLLSEKHTLNAGLIFNYCPSYIAEGYYKFYNLPWESYGAVNLGVNYLGLKVGYSLLF